MTRAPEPRLQSVFGGAELPDGFAGGVALDFAQEEGGAKERREVVEVLVNHLADFCAGVDLLGIRPIVGEALGDGQFVFVLGVVKRNRGARLSAAALHQCSVDDDAREPSRELRAALEAFEVAVSGKQTVLQSIFGVLGITQDAQSRLEQLALITAKEGLDRLSVATLAGADQLLFVQLRIAKLRSTHHLRCHLLPPYSLLRVVTNSKVTDGLQAQCTGIPPCALGLFMNNRIGMMAKKTTPSILKLSRKASMVACR